MKGFGNQLFTAIILVLSAGISTHICYGYGTKKAKEAFAALILLLLLGTQFYHLIYAANYVPATRFYVFNRALHRTDCLESGKGGKRPSEHMELIDRNPCFCLPSFANCTDISTGIVITNGTSCPYDGSALCLDRSTGSRIKPFHSRKRDCRGGQAPYCTKDQPCTPCDRASLADYGAPRCRTCSTDFTGDCHFIEDQGPYCFAYPNSKYVVPCTKCCTEPDPIIVNGTCY